ncbi:thiamine-phosphate kinase [Steroidobacter sp. S1-65]|uniref:Thiamine-monophosphate kinase n=1 Tax=Steroidobacter gossypii TaxID=2805490 RepID=A0ABS1X1A8_9GAMM|nr:thiamine-phosphate kinase [Steroidobacter gossypii]MBM0107034.1 thiamine-phosphate kinase [Steroidobacter gossypii]
MSLGEFDIIARYFARQSARGDVLLGVGDDAAVLDTQAGRKLVVAMDTIVEGVHFLADSDATDIGYRAVAVNLSDLAAMGAEPAWMTLSLSLPRANEQWLSGFASGLFELADEYNVALVGGDTVRGPLVVTVQVAGWVEADAWLTRSGAKPGDLLFVSGIPGEAAAGLAVIQRSMLGGEAAAFLKHRFLRPRPRIELGRQLRTVATAAMDVSDGLVTDLRKLCAASGCGAQLNVDALPESAAMRELFEADDGLQYALAGGDDYELLFTLPADRAAAVLSELQLQQRVTQIGVMTGGEPSVQCLRDAQPFRIRRAGYDHFNTGEAGS